MLIMWKKGNIYTDYIVNKYTRAHTDTVWEGDFPQLELALKNATAFIYEMMFEYYRYLFLVNMYKIYHPRSVHISYA